MDTNLTKEQKEIIMTTEPRVVVNACAGAGKTKCMIERVRTLLQWGTNPAEIVVITFTNQAASELRERLSDTPNSERVFVGTIHSYCNTLLLMGGIDTSRILNEENFDELFDLISTHYHVIPKVTHLLVDEAQDCDGKQYEFFFNYVRPLNFMMIGDWRQSIYEWRGAEPQLLIDLSKQDDVKTYTLSTNFRSGARVIKTAAKVLDALDPDFHDYSLCGRGVRGQVTKLEGVLEAIDLIMEDGNYGSWFIVCRTNQEISDVCYVLARKGIPYDSFKQSELDRGQLIQKMKDNTVKVLTVHAAKGLENDNVVVIGMRPWGKDEEKRIKYVAYTRARDHLYIVKTQSKKKKFQEW